MIRSASQLPIFITVTGAVSPLYLAGCPLLHERGFAGLEAKDADRAFRRRGHPHCCGNSDSATKHRVRPLMSPREKAVGPSHGA